MFERDAVLSKISIIKRCLETVQLLYEENAEQRRQVGQLPSHDELRHLGGPLAVRRSLPAKEREAVVLRDKDFQAKLAEVLLDRLTVTQEKVPGFSEIGVHRALQETDERGGVRRRLHADISGRKITFGA